MILTMDIGNTNIKTALFDGKEMYKYWRMSTNITSTSDEYGVRLMSMFAHEGVSRDVVEGIVVSSVVPTINYTIEHMLLNYIGKAPLFVAPGVKTGINIKYENPRELGSDRIANAVAAYEEYGGPCIFIDFGTATTFGVVDKEGSFLGGTICPGIKLSSEALVTGTAKLPRFELNKPENVIGRTTLSNQRYVLRLRRPGAQHRAQNPPGAGGGRLCGGHRRHGADDRGREQRDRQAGRTADPQGPAADL